jgi:hypothetical protein
MSPTKAAVAAAAHKAAIQKSFWTVVNQNNTLTVQIFLKKHEAEIDKDARYAPAMNATALHIAAQKNNASLAELLLDIGIDINAQNRVCLSSRMRVCRI